MGDKEEEREHEEGKRKREEKKRMEELAPKRSTEGETDTPANSDA